MGLRASQEAVFSMFPPPQSCLGSCPGFLQCWPGTGGSYRRSECFITATEKQLEQTMTSKSLVCDTAVLV